MNEQTITIDGKKYEIAELNDKAKADLASLQIVDKKIIDTRQELAILQTARNAYAKSLSEQLPRKKN